MGDILTTARAVKRRTEGKIGSEAIHQIGVVAKCTRLAPVSLPDGQIPRGGDLTGEQIAHHIDAIAAVGAGQLHVLELGQCSSPRFPIQCAALGRSGPPLVQDAGKVAAQADGPRVTGRIGRIAERNRLAQSRFSFDQAVH